MGVLVLFLSVAFLVLFLVFLFRARAGHLLGLLTPGLSLG